MVSSTATTFSYAHMSRQDRHLGAVATPMLRSIIWPRIAFGAVLLLLAGSVFFTLQQGSGTDVPENRKPARINTALTFAAIYVVVLFAVAAARDLMGNDAVNLVAFASGLTDVDALTLSMARPFSNGKLEGDVAWRAVFLASLSNLVFWP